MNYMYHYTCFIKITHIFVVLTHWYNVIVVVVYYSDMFQSMNT